MSLRTYRKKRNFKLTPEPADKGEKSSNSDLIFVVQKHNASHLHYDFRLEMDGILKSWAVPRGPSLDPKQKRLAVEVEDHPIPYATFEGKIPKGEYGGGSVIVWDRGTWSPSTNARAQLKKGHLEFELRGEKLRGRWNLVRTRTAPAGKKSTWLLLKRTDNEARSAAEGEIVDDLPLSVVSGRDVFSIENTDNEERAVEALAKPAPSHARKRAPKLAPKPAPKPAKIGYIEPQLAKLVGRPPEGSEYIHEIKYDGYRMLAHVDGKAVRFFSRNGHDWTAKVPALVKACGKLGIKGALLDGEVAAVDSEGRTSFTRLQDAFSDGRDEALCFLVFDILFAKGTDIRSEALTRRKEMLQNLLGKAGDGPIVYSDHFSGRGSGASAFRAACAQGLEGIITKNAMDPYRSGRVGSWTKSKCKSAQEFVIGGYTLPEGSRSGIGALLLGVQEDGGLRYAGKVGTGFSDATLNSLARKLTKLESPDSPFARKAAANGRSVRWVKPSLVANIEFGGWTGDGMIRHGSFQGLREDKAAKEVVIETAEKPRAIIKSGSTSAKRLTHPERVVFPKAGLTKQDLFNWYAVAKDFMEPHLRDRPLSILRCPDGLAGSCFFQKHWETKAVDVVSENVRSVARKERETIFYAQSPDGVLELAQMGAIEIHLWGARRTNIDLADQVVFDLDPGEGVKWERMREAGFEVKEMLSKLGLSPFVKLTGGKGLHVQAAIKPIYSWAQINAFCKTIALELTARDPKSFIATVSKAKRKGLIFVDYMRNGLGATAVSPYSLRARPTAGIAMPISWADLKTAPSGDAYSLKDGARLLAKRRKDPWADYFAKSSPIALLEKHARGE